jgi:hypothetical protein
VVSRGHPDGVGSYDWLYQADSSERERNGEDMATERP